MKKINKLKVVLDTNVLLVSLPPRSPYRLIFDKLLDGTYELYISKEILTEYEEKIAERYDPQTVKELVGLLLILPNVHEITPYFRWKLIVNDADDDKFVEGRSSQRD
jgi:predicted nucleic acid-binding protein